MRNLYAELGTSFASSAVTHPRHCAAMLGTLIKGMGDDHLIWGTDSVWYGSPQWQIEAMRRLEIPDDMQEKWGFAPLGAANGTVKSAIFGYNAARLYGLDLTIESQRIAGDRLTGARAEYLARGADPATPPTDSSARASEPCRIAPAALEATAWNTPASISSRP